MSLTQNMVEDVSRRLETLAHEAAPQADLFLLRSAIAEAFGFDSHLDLMSALRDGALDADIDFCARDFEERIFELGYSGDFGDLEALARQSEAVVLPFLPPGRKKRPDGSRLISGEDDMNRLFRGFEVRHERKNVRILSALAAQGLPPAQHSTMFSPQYSEWLGYGFRWTDGDQIEIRLSTANYSYLTSKGGHGGHRPIWGKPWPHYGVTVSAGDLLAFMASSWSLLADGYAKVPRNREGLVDFRAGINRPDLPPFEIAVRPRDLEIRADRAVCRPGSETLMVMESLVTLGDGLAKGLQERGLHVGAVAAWFAAREIDDLPPIEAERGGDEPLDEYMVRAGAVYYAPKLGLALDRYRAAALFDSAAHRLWYEHGREGGEPQGGDGVRGALRGMLPSDGDIHRMVEEAIRLTGDPDLPDFASWEIDALHQANMDARARVFYANWPHGMAPLTFADDDFDPDTLVGKTVQTKRGGAGVVMGVAGMSAVGEEMVVVRFRSKDGANTDVSWSVSTVLEMIAAGEATKEA